jgi:hypothetical protein
LQRLDDVVAAAVVAARQQVPEAGADRGRALGRALEQKLLELLQEPLKGQLGGREANHLGLQVASERQQALHHQRLCLELLQQHRQRLRTRKSPTPPKRAATQLHTPH